MEKDREDDDQDIHDVMREEKARSKRHIDTGQLEKQRRLKKLSYRPGAGNER